MLTYKVTITTRYITPDYKYDYVDQVYSFWKDGQTAYRWAEIAANMVDDPNDNVRVKVEVKRVPDPEEGKEDGAEK